MPENRLQHFVPACYLKYFTTERTRDGTLFAFNSKTNEWRKTSPDRECARAYHYAKNLSVAEDPFRVTFENDYSHYADRAIEGRRLSTVQQFRLFAFAVQLYLRNPSMKHMECSDNKIVHFRGNFDTMMSELLPMCGPLTKTAILDAFDRAWDVRCLHVHSTKVLTSDNPSAMNAAAGWRRELRTRDVTYVSLPLTPWHMLIAAKREHCRFRNNSTAQVDCERVQAATYGQRLLFAFSNKEAPVPGVTKHKIDDDERPQTGLSGYKPSIAIYESLPTFLRKV
jgi:hypothetical protein